MPEWSIGAVLKTARANNPRGFESLSLRIEIKYHESDTPVCVAMGFEGRAMREPPQAQAQSGIPLSPPKSAFTNITHMAEDKDRGKVLAEWDIDEFPKHERSRTWYVVALIIAGAFMLYAILSLNYLFAAIIIIVGVIIFMQNRREPQRLSLKIQEDGLAIGETTFYEWKIIKEFWIVYDPPDVKNVYFDFKTGIRPSISLPLEKQNPLNIRKILLNYLPEAVDKENESFSDGLRRMLKF